NPVDFRGSASTYTFGLSFQSPLNRYQEQNIYRTSLIVYQRSRRNYMMLEDQIRIDIRRELRQLKTERLNFEIRRQSLISAARQLEAARDRLLISEDAAGTANTQNILNALSALLNAKNGLIQSWVNYETGRIQLLLDMDVLQLDEQGRYLNEHDDR